MYIFKTTFSFILFVTLSQFAVAQDNRRNLNDVYVDENGVMRWGTTGSEVHGFGVNYTAPFAHAYRVAKQLNVPLEKAIDNDIYHFARLGFDAYRVHVWDTEISDSLGNLLENEHLRLFDYMLNKMKERGIKLMITPIAYWGNGWPEPDEKTPGFSAKYGKAECLINPGAIKAQENYLYQFLNHVNPYTKLAYKDDPDIIGFEISNEPHHKEAPEKVTEFISKMVASMRKTGSKKLIFYNISHSIHLVDAYYNAGIQGGTFQWYPTGLGFRKELEGNFLPNVDKYLIPFANNERFRKQAKLVYEFDAADIGRSYIYPAMARSFREAGIQWATHFAYDPTYMAFANTEYNTHYMNLVYTPQKALSLKIASEVFHRIPMYKSFGYFPLNTRFDAFSVDYKKDLAELVTDQKFIYTNTTSTIPLAINKLEEIAGFGNSSVVNYEGQGAYFLDKIDKGVWRLEVLPDAIWVKDPFGRNSLKKELAVINWRSWPIAIKLPDLGDNYSVVPINEGNTLNASVQATSFNVTPGTYLLVRKGQKNKYKGDEKWKNIKLNEFTAPPAAVKKTYVLHTPPSEITEADSFVIEATVLGKDVPESVFANISGQGIRPIKLELKKLKGYKYAGVVSPDIIKKGFINYTITVRGPDAVYTYPSEIEAQPSDWDYYGEKNYKIPVKANTSPLYLFNAATDHEGLTREWKSDNALVPLDHPGEAQFVISIDKLFTPDPENTTAEKNYDYSLRYSFKSKIDGRKESVAGKKLLKFKGASLSGKVSKIQIALITTDGAAFGKVISISPKENSYTIPLDELEPVSLVTLPRPYPSFLPYFFRNKEARKLDLNALEALQFSIGPGLTESEKQDKFKVAIETVSME